jgi:integral membrane sensor domain MASE1
MRKAFPALLVLLLVAAWRFRDNRPVFFVIVATLFAVVAIPVSGSGLPESILQGLALGWLACMLVASVFGIVELTRYMKKRKASAVAEGRKEH